MHWKAGREAAIEQNGKESLSFKVKKTLRLAPRYQLADQMVSLKELLILSMVCQNL